MATELGKAYVQIVPSAKGISGTVTNALNGEAGSAGTTAGSTLAGRLKGALRAAGIGIALKQAISEGAALEQSIGGIDAIFKDSAAKVKENAKAAYREAGISANQYMEQATSFSASLLQSLGGDTDKAAKVADVAIKDMADNANKMGTSIDMIQNAYQGFAKQNYTMLDNLKLGYGGTKTEMERLLADASKLSGVEYDMSNLNDVYEAIHVIQEEMGITGATAAEAAGTLSGSFGSMKAAFSDFLGTITLGNDGINSIRESITNLVTSANTFLFGNLIPALGKIVIALPQALIEGLKAGIPQVGATLGKWLKNLQPEAAKLILKIGAALKNNVPALIDSATTLLRNFVQYLQENAPAIFQNVGRLIGLLGAKIIAALPNLIPALGKLVLAIGSFALKLPGIAVDAAKGLIKGFVKGINTGPIKQKMDAVKKAITAPIDKAKELIRAIIEQIKTMFRNLKLSFPKVKLPHFKVTKGKAPWGLGGSGQMPKVSINWYKKGGIFQDPSLIGVGEAGTEAVVPLDKLWKEMDSRAPAIDYGKMAAVLSDALSGVQITLITNLDGKVVAKETAPFMQSALDTLTSRNNRKLGYL